MAIDIYTPYLIENRSFLIQEMVGRQLQRVVRYYGGAEYKASGITHESQNALARGHSPLVLEFTGGLNITFTGFVHLSGCLIRRTYPEWELWGEYGVINKTYEISSDDTLWVTDAIDCLLRSEIAKIDLIGTSLPQFTYQLIPRSPGLHIQTKDGKSVWLCSRLDEKMFSSALLSTPDILPEVNGTLGTMAFSTPTTLDPSFFLRELPDGSYRLSDWVQWLPVRNGKVYNQWPKDIRLPQSALMRLKDIRQFVVDQKVSCNDWDLWLTPAGDLGFHGFTDALKMQDIARDLEILDEYLKH